MEELGIKTGPELISIGCILNVRNVRPKADECMRVRSHAVWLLLPNAGPNEVHNEKCIR